VLLVETNVREELLPSQFINSPNRKSLLLVWKQEMAIVGTACSLQNMI